MLKFKISDQKKIFFVTRSYCSLPRLVCSPTKQAHLIPHTLNDLLTIKDPLDPSVVVIPVILLHGRHS